MDLLRHVFAVGTSTIRALGGAFSVPNKKALEEGSRGAGVELIISHAIVINYDPRTPTKAGRSGEPGLRRPGLLHFLQNNDTIS